jgi:hypothetical protein
MARRDAIGLLLACDEREELVAHAPRRLFDTEMPLSSHRRHVAFTRYALNAEGGANRPRTLHVVSRMRPQLVVEVRRAHLEPVAPPECAYEQ